MTTSPAPQAGAGHGDAITTVEALDALPVGRVVAGPGIAALRGFYGAKDVWYVTNGGRYDSRALLRSHGPLVLLHDPSALAAARTGGACDTCDGSGALGDDDCPGGCTRGRKALDGAEVDADGIAGVLADHVTTVRWARDIGLPDAMHVSACSCGWHGWRSVTHVDASVAASVAERAHHQAEAVAAYLRGAS